MLRDHQPVPIDKFNGLWQRGDYENVPLDHFQDCENIAFRGTAGIQTRPGIGLSQDVDIPLTNIKRIYNYPTNSANTLIVLAYDYATDMGSIYHVVDSTTVFGPLLTIAFMTDFAFVPYGGRGYISPFNSSLPVTPPPAAGLTATLAVGSGVEIGAHTYVYTFVTDTGETIASPAISITVTAGNEQVDLTDISIGPSNCTARNVYRSEAGLSTPLKLLTVIADNTTTVFTDITADASLGADSPTVNSATIGSLRIDKGIQNEFLYVYAGDGTAARKAAGAAISGSLTIANGAAGHTDAGFHVFGVVTETISGYLSPPGALTTFTTAPLLSVSIGNIPTSGDPNVVARHIVATKVITGYNGNPGGYAIYFIPGATIPNNTQTFINNISFFDQDLLDHASRLYDNFTEIPAGAVLTLYHNRLVIGCFFDFISNMYASLEGEPEAINEIEGLIEVPPDGNPITNAQELRDVLYTFKRSRTVSFADNGDVPSSWELVIIDNALGTSVHGIATVLDSGSSSVDYLIVCTYQGISLFNGRFVTPELSWKVESLWQEQDRNASNVWQIINAPIQKLILIIMTDGRVLVGNYSNGMDPMKIRWVPWRFLMNVNTIAIFNIDEIVFGADLVSA